MIDQFKITLRHYKTIVTQGQKNLPQESGGFVGGKDGVIQAILPLFNQHLYDKTDTFAFTGEDVIRAHEFFKKHNLDYYGLYHTHPKGVAYPSQADIDTGLQYHFILSLRVPNKPEFAAFQVKDGVPIQIPFELIPDDGFDSIDIRAAKAVEEDNPFKLRSPKEDADSLMERIENMKSEKENKYPKMPPRNQGRSDFSTLA